MMCKGYFTDDNQAIMKARICCDASVNDMANHELVRAVRAWTADEREVRNRLLDDDARGFNLGTRHLYAPHSVIGQAVE